MLQFSTSHISFVTVYVHVLNTTNIIPEFTPRFSKRPLSFRFQTKTLYAFSSFPRSLHDQGLHGTTMLKLILNGYGKNVD